MNEDKITYGPEEKEILEILASFERELEEKLQNSNIQIQKVKYYETFKINEINFKNIFITTEKDEEGKLTYHVYCVDSSREILVVDSDGKVEIKDQELAKFLGKVDFEKVIEENDNIPGKLKGVSEKAEPEEMKKSLKGEKTIEDSDSKEEETKDEETQQIQKDLQEQGEDLRISEYKKIKEPYIAERMPEVFEDGQENGIAFSNTLNRFVIISKVNGKYQLNENAEPGRMTWKTIISIAPNGERVERKVPYALMKVPGNQNKEIAVVLDQYGDAFIETVDVLPSQERLARAVRTEGQGIETEETIETRREFNTEGEFYKRDIAENVQNIEDAQRKAKQTVDYSITEDDFIPNTEKTWGELMNETGESLVNLIERYNREMAREGADPKKVLEIIELDYGYVNRQRQQGPN